MPRSKEAFEEVRTERTKLILESALRLFALEGYDKITVDDIAKDCNMSHGLFYHYFSSKEQVFHALMGNILSKWNEEDTILDKEDNPSFIIRDLTNFYISKITDGQDGAYMVYMFLTWHLGRHFPTSPKGPRPKERRRFPRMVKVIEKGQQSGVFASGNSCDMVFTYYCTIMGLAYSAIKCGCKAFKCVDPQLLNRVFDSNGAAK